MKLAALLVAVWCSLSCIGQEVQVSGDSTHLILVLPAKSSYNLSFSQQRTPILRLECSSKGKKSGHVLSFTADTDLEAQTNSGPVMLTIVVNGRRRVTPWMPYGDTVTFAFYGKTEPERVEFLKTVLALPTLGIEFKPFLTGQTATAVFDMKKLQEEVATHPECALN